MSVDNEALTLSVADTVLKEFYEEPIKEALLSEVSAWERYSVEPGNYVGKKHILTMKTGRNTGVGARPEEGLLPIARTPSWIAPYLTVAYHYGRIRLTGQARHIVSGDEGALIDALHESVTDMVMSFKVDLNRVFYGDQKGRLCQTVGTTSAAQKVITVDNPGSRFLESDMLIEAFDGTTIKAMVSTSNEGEIDTVDSPTQITMVDNIHTEIPDNSYLYRDGVQAAAGGTYYEMNGLQGIVDDGTYQATFQGLARSSYDQLKAHILSNSGVNRDLTETLLQEAIDIPYQRAGVRINEIVTHPAMISKYIPDLMADRMFMVNAAVGNQKYQGGYDPNGLSFAGAPIVQDRDCPYNKIFCNDRNSIFFKIAGRKMINWMDDDGQVFVRVQGYDLVEASLRIYGQLGCDYPMGNLRIDDVDMDDPTWIEYR